jgi:hypothetical protein
MTKGNGNSQSPFKDFGIREYVMIFTAITLLVSGGGSVVSNLGVQKAVQGSVFSEAEVKEIARSVTNEKEHVTKEEVRDIAKEEDQVQQQILEPVFDNINGALNRVESDVGSIKRELNLR